MSQLSAELTNESMRYASRAKELYRQVGTLGTQHLYDSSSFHRNCHKNTLIIVIA